MKSSFVAAFILYTTLALSQQALVMGPLIKKQKPLHARLHFDDSGRAISIVTLKNGRQLHVTDALLTQSKTFTYQYELAEGETLQENNYLLPENAQKLLSGSTLIWEQVRMNHYNEYLVNPETGTLVTMRTNLQTGSVETVEILSVPDTEYPVHLQRTADGFLYITLSPKANLFKLHRLHNDGSKKTDEITIDLSGLHNDGKLDKKKDAHLDKMFDELMLLDLVDIRAAGVADSLQAGGYHDFEKSSGLWKKYQLGDTLALFTTTNKGDALLNINLMPTNNTYSQRVINSPASTMGFLQKIAPDVTYQNETDFDKKASPICYAYSQRYFALIRVHKPHFYIQYFDRTNDELHHMEYFSTEKAEALSGSQIKSAPWFVDSSKNNAITSQKFLNVMVATLGLVGFDLIDVSPDSVQALLMVKDERIKLSDVAGAVIESAASVVPVGSLIGAFAVGAAGSMVGDLSTLALSMVENKDIYCLSRRLDAKTLMPPSGFPVAPLPELKKLYDKAMALQSQLAKGISVVSMATYQENNYVGYFDEANNQYLLKKL